MARHERQDRTHARAVRVGIAISVAVHAAALALVRFSVPALDEARVHRVATASEAVPPVIEPAMQVVALRETPVAEAAALSVPAEVRVEALAPPAPEPSPVPDAGSVAETTPAPEPVPAPEAALAIAEVADAPAAAMPRTEPDAAPGRAVLADEPADAAAQAAAVQPEAATEEKPEYDLPAGVPLHQPGSVGRAKGKWSGGEEERGGGYIERRRGVIVIGGGRDGRHCPPLPGRRPPTLR